MRRVKSTVLFSSGTMKVDRGVNPDVFHRFIFNMFKHFKLDTKINFRCLYADIREVFVNGEQSVKLSLTVEDEDKSAIFKDSVVIDMDYIFERKDELCNSVYLLLDYLDDNFKLLPCSVLTRFYGGYKPDWIVVETEIGGMV